jgi:Zn-dependent M28 family amino/carboxypeptidase
MPVRGFVTTAVAILAAAALAGALPTAASATGAYPAAHHIAAKIGKRVAGSPAEARAHAYVAAEFRKAGLPVEVSGFAVPGHGRSRNVIATFDTPRDCLEILMAHTDSVATAPGADDNGSGLGVLVGLAPRLAVLHPACDVWLVATGAEERVFTGTSYHVGSQALVGLVKSRGRAGDLRFALSLDMLGRGRRFYLRSPQPAARPAVEGRILAAARAAGVELRWARDSETGNSDHREFELAGLPGAVIEVWRGFESCHHLPCDKASRLQKGALARVQRIVEKLVAEP